MSSRNAEPVKSFRPSAAAPPPGKCLIRRKGFRSDQGHHITADLLGATSWPVSLGRQELRQALARQRPNGGMAQICWQTDIAAAQSLATQTEPPQVRALSHSSDPVAEDTTPRRVASLMSCANPT